MTRIFLYLLALVGGFSAAEAARPVSAQPAELGAPAAMAAAVAATYAAVQQEVSGARPVQRLAANNAVFAASPHPVARPATVFRGDRARE